MQLPPTPEDWDAFYGENLAEYKVINQKEALALCPFHDDHDPSLHIQREKGLYHCFPCGAKGNGITFARKMNLGEDAVPGQWEFWRRILPSEILKKSKELETEFGAEDASIDSATPRGSKPCGINFKPRTAYELLKLKLPERVWIWKDHIAEGCVVILSGFPKAGKTTLAYHLVKAITQGAPFLGYATQKCPILILALEEHIRDVQDRMRRLSITHENVLVHSGLLKTLPQELEAIKRFVKEKEIKLIVVDTLSRFWMVKDDNSAADMSANMEPILNLARQTNTGMLLLYHLRKSPGEEGTDIRGSGDLFAIVDAALNFYRRGKAKTERVLTGYSRYSALEDRVIVLDDDGYRALGSKDKVEAYEQKTKILRALASGETKTADQIATEIGIPAGTVRAVLLLMLDDGEVERAGEGKRGKPYVFSLPPKRKQP